MPATRTDQPSSANLDAVDLALLDRWQHDFPLTERPFYDIGASLALSEEAVLSRYSALQSAGLISRIGAIIAPNTIGVSTLAAVAAAPDEVDRIARFINEERGVNHNYEREHPVNLWFVIAAADEAELEAALSRLSRRLRRPVRDLRLEKPYHLNLGFPISGEGSRGEEKRRFQIADAAKLEPKDRRLLSVLADGLPITMRPYNEIGGRAEMTGAHVLARLNALIEAGIVRRFGVILRHRQFGYAANAMVVFDIDNGRVDEIGERLARVPGVTLCYRRRRAFDWPYNLYCMVHARSRAEAEPLIASLREATEPSRRDMAVLFSTRCFRQRGVRFGAGEIAGEASRERASR